MSCIVPSFNLAVVTYVSENTVFPSSRICWSLSTTLRSIWCFKVQLSTSLTTGVAVLLRHVTLFSQLIQNRQTHDSAAHNFICSHDISSVFISCHKSSSDTICTCMEKWMDDEPNWKNARQIYIEFRTCRQFWITRFSTHPSVSVSVTWMTPYSINTVTC